MPADPGRHMELTRIRATAFNELFGDKPVGVFPAHQLVTGPDDPFLIDVLVYALDIEGSDDSICAAVTNGMSDFRRAEGEDPDQPRRRELIQYFHDCTLGHAKRLRDMAWIPLHDEFLLDCFHTIGWEWPAVEGTPWKNALFLESIWAPHRDFVVEVEDEEVSLLWHIPISEEERHSVREEGIDAFLDLMQEANLPWVFDEGNRTPLVPVNE
jgi:hypothetical protein